MQYPTALADCKTKLEENRNKKKIKRHGFFFLLDQISIIISIFFKFFFFYFLIIERKIKIRGEERGDVESERENRRKKEKVWIQF